MIFKLTNKLSEKFKTGPLRSLEADTEPFEEWYGHLFTADRKQYILMTEAQTLFSCIIPKAEIKSLNDLLGISPVYIFKVLMFMEMPDIMDRYINKHLKTIISYKTNSRGILGSMNDMIYLSKVYMIEYKLHPVEISSRLNSTPWGYLKYEIPKYILMDLIDNQGNNSGYRG